jgi:hypothetical protein
LVTAQQECKAMVRILGFKARPLLLTAMEYWAVRRILQASAFKVAVRVCLASASKASADKAVPDLAGQACRAKAWPAASA